MGLGKKTIDDENYVGKRVLVRCDFNVPMKDGVITNDNRINAALPTIKKLINDGAKVILCSHLGKPKNGPEAKFSLAQVKRMLYSRTVPSVREKGQKVKRTGSTLPQSSHRVRP